MYVMDFTCDLMCCTEVSEGCARCFDAWLLTRFNRDISDEHF